MNSADRPCQAQFPDAGACPRPESASRAQGGGWWAGAAGRHARATPSGASWSFHVRLTFPNIMDAGPSLGIFTPLLVARLLGRAGGRWARRRARGGGSARRRPRGPRVPRRSGRPRPPRSRSSRSRPGRRRWGPRSPRGRRRPGVSEAIARSRSSVPRRRLPRRILARRRWRGRPRGPRSSSSPKRSSRAFLPERGAPGLGGEQRLDGRSAPSGGAAEGGGRRPGPLAPGHLLGLLLGQLLGLRGDLLRLFFGQAVDGVHQVGDLHDRQVVEAEDALLDELLGQLGVDPLDLGEQRRRPSRSARPAPRWS